MVVKRPELLPRHERRAVPLGWTFSGDVTGHIFARYRMKTDFEPGLGQKNRFRTGFPRVKIGF